MYGYRVDTLKALNEANAATCKALNGDIHDLKLSKHHLEKEQDTLVSCLSEIDNVEKHLDEVETSINNMDGVIKRISTMLDMQNLRCLTTRRSVSPRSEERGESSRMM